MNQLEIHFFHGFLGEPADWDPIIDELKDLDCQFICHNLLDDLSDFQIQENDGFQAWKSLKERQIAKSTSRKVGVAYSLGGRLASHLDSEIFDQLFLLASHPGLSADKPQRLATDIKRANEILEMEWGKFLEEWNSQEVFINDRFRPNREGQKRERQKWSQVLDLFSLGRQSLLDENLKTWSGKIKWLRGESDNKFSQLDGRMKSLIGSESVVSVPEAGHGLIFDRPKELADIIKRSVEI